MHIKSARRIVVFCSLRFGILYHKYAILCNDLAHFMRYTLICDRQEPVPDCPDQRIDSGGQ